MTAAPQVFISPPRPCERCHLDMNRPDVGQQHPGKYWDVCPRCFQRALDQAKVTARAAAIRAMPEHYHSAAEESVLSTRVKPVSAIEKARAALVGTLGLYGPAGSGKSTLAVHNAVRRASLQEAREDPGSSHLRLRSWTPVFVTSMTLARARAQHKLGDGEAPEIERAVSARLLILDELGAEIGRDSATAEVIHRRHECDRPTIYTTPFTFDELVTKYGAGIARRLVEGATIIQLGAKK